nr:WhiB family transcriptional regulator [Streptomyces chartreusis]
MKKGACVSPGVKPEVFFTSHEGTARRGWDREAKVVCSACPVRQECLRSALQEGIRYGVWGD